MDPGKCSGTPSKDGRGNDVDDGDDDGHCGDDGDGDGDGGLQMSYLTVFCQLFSVLCSVQDFFSSARFFQTLDLDFLASNECFFTRLETRGGRR